MHINGITKIKKSRIKAYKWAPPATTTYTKYSHKLIGALIKNGGKMGALRKVLALQGWMKKNYKLESYKLLFVAYLKVSPVLQPRYIKTAGKMQPIAYGLMGEDKRVSFAIKWTIKMARAKGKRTSIQIGKLGDLLYNATRNQGELFEYKQQWQQELMRNSRKMPAQLNRLHKTKIHAT